MGREYGCMLSARCTRRPIAATTSVMTLASCQCPVQLKVARLSKRKKWTICRWARRSIQFEARGHPRPNRNWNLRLSTPRPTLRARAPTAMAMAFRGGTSWPSNSPKGLRILAPYLHLLGFFKEGDRQYAVCFCLWVTASQNRSRCDG
jgi:hypothetical protein